MKPLFTISILALNKEDITRQCIDSFINQKYDFDIELILTNNGSTDGTKNYFIGLATRNNKKVTRNITIKIINHDSNIGFIEGHKKALEKAKGRYFLMLNNDSYVGEEWLNKIKECFEDREVKIVGPMMRMLNKSGRGFAIGEEYIEGSCLVIPTSFAKSIGLFSNYLEFAYCEDSDLSLRVRAMGYKIKKVDMEFTHLGQQTHSECTNIDLEGLIVKNHYALVSKWKKYLATKDFKETIHILRDAAIGDVFLITPIIEALKKENIYREINVVTKCEELLVGNPYITCINGPVSNEDRIIDLNNAYEKEPNMNIVDAYAKVANIDLIHKTPKLYISENDVSFRIHEFVNKYKDNYIVFHADNSWQGRTLPHDKFVKLVYKAKMDGYKTVQIGNSLESITCDEKLTKENIQSLCYLIKHSVGFIGIDSMPMHIAQSFSKPGAVIFGCINPEYRIFVPELMRPIYENSVGCKFCHHWREAPVVHSDCLRNSAICMEVLNTDFIYNEFKKGLEVWMASLETTKIRDKVLKYCEGYGIDIGCRDDKIKEDTVGLDKENFKCVDFIADASKRLGFDDETFDYIYSSHALEDIEDTEGTLEEWLRILKHNGFIILHMPHADLYKGCNIDHKHNYRNEDITPILMANNCEIVESYVDRGENRYSFVIVARKK